MKKVLVVLAIAGALFFAKKKFAGESSSSESGSSSSLASVMGTSPEKKTQERFETFMKNWKEGGVSLNNAEQAAACLWGRGVVFIRNSEDFRDAVESFERFRKAKGLYVPEISYQIHSYRREADHTIVDLSINGSRHRVSVPDGPNPIAWAD
jgi:hypothetical protein